VRRSGGEAADKNSKEPLIVKEYRHHTYTCFSCQKSHTAPKIEERRRGLFSAGLIALVAYLKESLSAHFSKRPFPNLLNPA
jgi:hypothetical protein